MAREGERFRLTGGDVSYAFGLHYRRYRERYGIYWKICEGSRQAENAPREPLDTVQCGYGQYETDALHALREQNSVSVTAGTVCRYAEAGGWFEYDLRVDPSRRNLLSVGLTRADNFQPLNVTVCGEEVFCGEVNDTLDTALLYRREFAIADGIVKKYARRKTKDGEAVWVLPVRFAGTAERASARVCDFLYIFTEDGAEK